VNREGCSRILSGLALSFRLPRTLSIWWFFAVIVGLAYLIAPGNVGAQITILYSFGGGKPAAGVHPNGGLVLGRDGELYGTTEEELDTRTWGFPSGTVFRFDPATSRFNDLKSFLTAKHRAPQSPLLLFHGGIVGGIAQTNHRGGSIFYLGSSGSAQIWHEFGLQKTNGNDPSTPLMLGPDGDIYGATVGGGANNQGTVYQLNPATHELTLLHSFSLSGPYRPRYLILGQDGNFYGYAFSSSGMVILMMTPAGAVTTLYTFNGSEEFDGLSLTQASDGTFYGTTEILGTYNKGTLFKMAGTPPSVTVTVLHSFGQGIDGFYPGGVVVGPNGNLYGVTAAGGTGKHTAGDGIIFEITTDGSTYTVLHNFNDGSIPNDGSDPVGGLTVGTDNNLYGTTFQGGAYGRAKGGFGMLFRLSP